MPKENSLPLPPRSGRLPPPVCMAAKSQDGENTTVAAALAAALPAACIGIETKNLIMHASRSRPIMEIMRAPLARSCRVRARAAFSSTRCAVPGVLVCEQRGAVPGVSVREQSGAVPGVSVREQGGAVPGVSVREQGGAVPGVSVREQGFDERRLHHSHTEGGE